MDPSSSHQTPPSPQRHGAWLALWVTVGGVTVSSLAVLWLAPGLNQQVKGILGLGGQVSQWSIVTFGLTPIITGFCLTELLALFIPSWRRWRIQGQPGRQKLYWIALGIGLLVLSFQVFSSLAFFQRYQLLPTSTTGTIGFKTYLYVFVGFALGTFGLVALAEIIGKWGLGNGFSVLLASALIPALLEQGYSIYSGFKAGLRSVGHLLAPLLFVALLTYLLWKLFRLRISSVNEQLFVEQLTAPLRKIFGWSESAITIPASLPKHQAHLIQRPAVLTIPTCGILPYSTAVALISGTVTLATLDWIPTTWIYRLTPDSLYYMLAVSAFIVIFGVVYSLLFFRVRAVMPWLSDSFKTGDISSDQAQFRQIRRKMVWISTLFLLVLFHTYSYLQGVFEWSISLYAWVIGLAVVLDLWAEWTARRWHGPLVSIRPVHRLYTLHTAVATLQDAQIPVHVRSFCHRSLLQFFGPFIPVELMVPQSQAETAKALLDDLYTTRDTTRLS